MSLSLFRVGIASMVEYIDGAGVGAKNQALSPGRVPHVRLSVHGPRKIGRSPFRRFCSTGKWTAAKRKSPRGWSESIGKNRFRPMYPDFLHGAPPIPACAAFIKESRMKFANAKKLDRKSGVR
jgi:hypothetical protein